jgi:hypothetical protein
MTSKCLILLVGYESNPYFEVCNFGFRVGSGFFGVF